MAAGVCANLQRDDLLTSTHRGHGHTLAKGADVDADDVRAVRPRHRHQQRQGRLDAHRRLLGRHAGRQRRGRRRHPDRRRRGACAEDPQAAATSSPASSATARSTAGRSSKALNWAAGVRAAGAVRLRGQPHLGDHADRPDDRPATARAARAESDRRAGARGRRQRCRGGRCRGRARWSARSAPAQGPRLLHAVTYRFKGHVSVDPGAYRDAGRSRARAARTIRCCSRATSCSRAASTPDDIDAIDARGAGRDRRRAGRPPTPRPGPTPARRVHRRQDTGAGRWR